jgi:hypothetical protein
MILITSSTSIGVLDESQIFKLCDQQSRTTILAAIGVFLLPGADTTTVESITWVAILRERMTKKNASSTFGANPAIQSGVENTAGSTLLENMVMKAEECKCSCSIH